MYVSQWFTFFIKALPLCLGKNEHNRKKKNLILPLYIEHCVKNKQIGNQLAHKGKKNWTVTLF